MPSAVDPAWKWVLGFCLVDFANRVVFGAFSTMLYPAQPFIAANVGVTIEAVTFMHSIGKWQARKKSRKREMCFINPTRQ